MILVFHNAFVNVTHRIMPFLDEGHMCVNHGIGISTKI